MAEYEIVSEGPAHCFAGVDNVLVSLYWAAPSAQALVERVPWVERAIQDHGKLGLLVVVCNEASGALPTTGFRTESRAQAKRFMSSILFSATVIEGDALHHSLARTFLRGLAVVAGGEIEVRFFDEAPPAISWATERAEPYGGPSVERVSDVLARLRKRRDHPPL